MGTSLLMRPGITLSAQWVAACLYQGDVVCWFHTYHTFQCGFRTVVSWNRVLIASTILSDSMAIICFAIGFCSATIFLKVMFILLTSQWMCTGWPSYLCTLYSTLYDRPAWCYRICRDARLNFQIITLQFFDACYLWFEGMLYTYRWTKRM